MSRIPTKADIERGHRRARKRQLNELIEHMQRTAGGPALLDDGQAIMVLGLLHDIREGVDVRETYGIKVKPGTKPSVSTRNQLIAAYSVKLREQDPGAPIGKAINPQIAAMTGIPEPTLKNILAKNAKAGAKLARVQTLEQIEQMLKFLIPIARS